MTQWTPIGSGGQYTDPTGMATGVGSFEDAQTGNEFSSAAYCKPRKPNCNSCRDRWEVKMGYDQLASQQAKLTNPKHRTIVNIDAPRDIGVVDFLHNNGLKVPNFPPKTKANFVRRHKPWWTIRRFGVEQYAWAVTGWVKCLSGDCVDDPNSGDGDLNFHLWDGTDPANDKGPKANAIKCEAPSDACTQGSPWMPYENAARAFMMNHLQEALQGILYVTVVGVGYWDSFAHPGDNNPELHPLLDVRPPGGGGGGCVHGRPCPMVATS
jgi:hypothetical protein